VPTSAAPPPDRTHTPQYVSQSVVEIIYAKDPKYRAVLTRDRKNLLRVRCQVWDTLDCEYTGHGFWREISKGATITDTVERARSLAAERLRELGAAV
jgi:hypothetical protein